MQLLEWVYEGIGSESPKRQDEHEDPTNHGPVFGTDLVLGLKARMQSEGPLLIGSLDD